MNRLCVSRLSPCSRVEGFHAAHPKSTLTLPSPFRRERGLHARAQLLHTSYG